MPLPRLTIRASTGIIRPRLINVIFLALDKALEQLTMPEFPTSDHPYDLSILQDGQYLRQLIAEQFNCPVIQLSKIGRGFYADIYQTSIDRDPYNVIVKCHKYGGRSAKEKEQLELLARYSILKVPQVYHLHLHSPELPFEALIMEYIPGINASQVAFPNRDVETRFVDTVVHNLLAWHAVSNPHGFGEIGGPFYGNWIDLFEKQIASYRQQMVEKKRRKRTASEYVMGVVDRSFEHMRAIFCGSNHASSLVHSDYNLWNVMVDPDTYEPTGVIDPIDAGWADREIDLFHLANCRPELGLLERYLHETETNEAFSLRYAFYRFWDDVKHYVRMGWYEEGRFRPCAQALEKEMNDAAL